MFYLSNGVELPAGNMLDSNDNDKTYLNLQTILTQYICDKPLL